MSIFEIQVERDGRWKANDIFEDYDAACECARRIEQRLRPERLRIRRVDLVKSGNIRERTMYNGGQKAQRERAAEKERQEREAYIQRVADRRTRQTVVSNAADNKKILFSSTSPVYLTLVSLSIFLTGLSAIYLVERAFMPY